MTLFRGLFSGAMNQTLAEAVRFSGAGLINTLLTVTLYQCLLAIFSPALAYAASWLVGIALVGAFYPRAVFKHRNGGTRVIRAAITIYLASFLLGLMTVRVLHYGFQLERTAVLLALPVTLSVNFFGLKFYLNRVATQ